jgi:hypothetical protein
VLSGTEGSGASADAGVSEGSGASVITGAGSVLSGCASVLSGSEDGKVSGSMSRMPMTGSVSAGPERGVRELLPQAQSSSASSKAGSRAGSLLFL